MTIVSHSITIMKRREDILIENKFRVFRLFSAFSAFSALAFEIFVCMSNVVNSFDQGNKLRNWSII